MGMKSVLDFGCNDGKFLKRLTFDPIFTRLAGGDLDLEELQKAKIVSFIRKEFIKQLQIQKKAKNKLKFFA